MLISQALNGPELDSRATMFHAVISGIQGSSLLLVLPCPGAWLPALWSQLAQSTLGFRLREGGGGVEEHPPVRGGPGSDATHTHSPGMWSPSGWTSHVAALNCKGGWELPVLLLAERREKEGCRGWG